MAASESQSLPKRPPRLPSLGATSVTVPAKQPSPPRGTSAGNCAAAAAAMDGRSTLLSPSPVPEPAAEERDGGVRGDGRGDADGFFFLPLERSIAARGGLKGRDGTAASGEPRA